MRTIVVVCKLHVLAVCYLQLHETTSARTITESDTSALHAWRQQTGRSYALLTRPVDIPNNRTCPYIQFTKMTNLSLCYAVLLQDQYDDIGQSSRPGSSRRLSQHRISRTLAAPLPPIPGQSTADDLHDHSARSPYHVYNYYDTHNPGVGAMDDETQCARIGPPSEPCSEHIYESAYSTRLNQAQTTTPSGCDRSAPRSPCPTRASASPTRASSPRA